MSEKKEQKYSNPKSTSQYSYLFDDYKKQETIIEPQEEPIVEPVQETTTKIAVEEEIYYKDENESTVTNNEPVESRVVAGAYIYDTLVSNEPKLIYDTQLEAIDLVENNETTYSLVESYHSDIAKKEEEPQISETVDFSSNFDFSLDEKNDDIIFDFKEPKEETKVVEPIEKQEKPKKGFFSLFKKKR